MDESPDEPRQPIGETIKCSMCQQRVPVTQSRTGQRTAALPGMPSDWYGEDEEEQI